MTDGTGKPRWRVPALLASTILLLAVTELRCTPATPPGSDPTARAYVARSADGARPHRRSAIHTAAQAADSMEAAVVLVLLGVGAGTRWHLP